MNKIIYQCDICKGYYSRRIKKGFVNPLSELEVNNFLDKDYQVSSGFCSKKCTSYYLLKISGLDKPKAKKILTDKILPKYKD